MKKKIIIVTIVVAVVFSFFISYKFMPYYFIVIVPCAYVLGLLFWLFLCKRKKGGRK
jgi:hypothetical protein